MAQARQAVQAAGFRVEVVREDTEDPTLDGLVTSQDPPGGTELEAGETITLFVGRFVEIPPDEPPPDEPPPPTTTDTETTPP